MRANLSSTGAYLRQISTDVSVLVEHVASSVVVIAGVVALHKGKVKRGCISGNSQSA
jgi:hypothetical protein